MSINWHPQPEYELRKQYDAWNQWKLDQLRQIVREEIEAALQRMLIGETRLKTCLAHGDDEKCEACRKDE